MVATSAVLLTACGGGKQDEIARLPTVVPSTRPAIHANEQTKNNQLGMQISQAKYVDGDILQQNIKVQLNELTEKVLDANFKSLDSYIVDVNGKRYVDVKGVHLEDWGSGFKDLNIKESADITTTKGKYTVNREGKAYLYQQDYSLIAHLMPAEVTITGRSERFMDGDSVETLVKGVPTVSLPEAGQAVYVGKAFVEYEGRPRLGDLNYVVDFTAKTGNGYISSDISKIRLHTGEISSGSYVNELDGTKISGYGIGGDASSVFGKGEYQLGFFGPKAEEIVGSVEFGDTSIGFGGIKQ